MGAMRSETWYLVGAMCGIHVSISQKPIKPSSELFQLLSNRGPDYVGREEAQIETNNSIRYSVSLISTVLSMRGDHIVHQPFLDESNGSMLCWNGEAWMVGPKCVTGNDGKVIFELLSDTTSIHCNAQATSKILGVLRSISGPFAFAFLDRVHNHLYYGRDRLGRRSLLHKESSNDIPLEICSVSDPLDGPWEEVEADGIYDFTITEDLMSFSYSSVIGSLQPPARFQKHLWEPCNLALSNPFLGTFNFVIPEELQALHLQAESIESLHDLLHESLRRRVTNIPSNSATMEKSYVRIAVLFSGGLDCSILARMLHEILPHNQEVDLLNVAFENPRVIRAATNRNLSENNKDGSIYNSTSNPDQLADSFFESCPDRETGRRSLSELQSVCPGRIWRFVTINVPYSETIAHRQTVINLIHPHNTEMDLSIAYALYFASRGIGVASNGSYTNPSAYTTPARVLLSGLGADELFGGYTRHSIAFSRLGLPGLLHELKLDIDRLGKRNLGRDDRVISHWGKEARFPFLDEAPVKWAVEAPISHKCGFGSPSQGKESSDVEIEPGKKVLRLLAYKLGMKSVSKEKKRAIQFGARTAKMQIGRVKGTTRVE